MALMMRLLADWQPWTTILACPLAAMGVVLTATAWTRHGRVRARRILTGIPLTCWALAGMWLRALLPWAIQATGRPGDWAPAGIAAMIAWLAVSGAILAATLMAAITLATDRTRR